MWLKKITLNTTDFYIAEIGDKEFTIVAIYEDETKQEITKSVMQSRFSLIPTKRSAGWKEE
ncbi:MAG TPA: hypothetical protein VLZ72_01955 [Flavobacterium sp.]|nr:hypothetical protein [Flavobacterium sp.]